MKIRLLFPVEIKQDDLNSVVTEITTARVSSKTQLPLPQLHFKNAEEICREWGIPKHDLQRIENEMFRFVVANIIQLSIQIEIDPVISSGD